MLSNAIDYQYYRLTTPGKLAPFRECYGRLHELRSLIPNAVILSLTATATRETKQAIVDVLGMKDPYKIEESPEKPNVSYVVEYMQRNQSLCHQFERYLSDYFNRNHSFHSYNTRRREDIHPSRPKLSLGKRTFRYSGVILFNSLPETFKRVASLKAFKRLMMKHDFA